MVAREGERERKRERKREREKEREREREKKKEREREREREKERERTFSRLFDPKSSAIVERALLGLITRLVSVDNIADGDRIADDHCRPLQHERELCSGYSNLLLRSDRLLLCRVPIRWILVQVLIRVL